MAYDEQLADRLRGAVSDEPGLTEKRMFGGLAFLVGGNLAVAASSHGGLMLRCDPRETAALRRHPGVTGVQMRGREVDGWLRVGSDAVAGDRDLRRWVEVGLAFARSLPPR